MNGNYLLKHFKIIIFLLFLIINIFLKLYCSSPCATGMFAISRSKQHNPDLDALLNKIFKQKNYII